MDGPVFETKREIPWGILLPIPFVLASGIIGSLTYRQSPLELTTASVATPEIVVPSINLTILVVKGDSYTTIARKAIATSGAIGLYAETILAEKLKSQPLMVGSEIIVSKKNIEEILASFSSLSPSQRQSWERLQMQTLPPR